MLLNRTCIGVLASCSVVVAGVIGWRDAGGQPIEKPKAETFVGTIRMLEIEKRVMTVEATPISKTFGIASDCEVQTKDKPKASLEDLAVGNLVNVTYEDTHGVLVAHRIEQTGPPRETGRQ
jgi:hypothetical protein